MVVDRKKENVVIHGQAIAVRPLKILSVNEVLSGKIMSAKRLKALKKFKYFTRFQKQFYVTSDEIDTEESMAKFVRNYYGYGIFKLCFFSWYNPNKWGRKDKNGNLRKKTRGMTPRAKVTIKEGFNSKTGEDFVYLFDPKEMKMGSFWFWKGKSKKKKEDKNINNTMVEDNTRRLKDMNMTELNK